MQTLSNLSVPEFEEVLRGCSGKTIVLDTETTGVYWWRDRLITVGFHCPEAGVEGTVDIGRPVPDPEDPEVMEFQEQVRKAVRECLAPGTKVLMHNAKFDMSMLGIDPNSDANGWVLMDSTVMIHLYDSRLRKGLELAEKELLGSNSKRSHIEKAPTNPKIRKRVWLWESHVRQDYCVNDCRVTFQLAQLLMPKLRKLDVEKLFWKDMKYLKQLYFTEHLGISLDEGFVGRACVAMLAHQKDLEQRLYDAVGYEFNWRSNVQLSKAIYQDMGIPMPVNPFATGGKNKSYRTDLGFQRVQELKGGMYNKTMTSTFLLMEKAHHPLGELIASLREASKLVKTMQLWLKLVDKDGFIHSNFNITGTRTGRLSSSKPNLANVASEVRSRFTQGLYSGGITRSEEYNLRNAFPCRPGHKMLSIDFKQQEMRLFAIESRDEHMLSFAMAGKDIHTMIAMAVWGDCGKEQNKIHREWSKTIGFGLLYGMSTGSLEHKLGMSKDQAHKVIEDYWGTFPRIRPYLFELIDQCKEHGMVRNWAKRIWREEVEMFMYKSCNFVVQGGSADLLSISAMRTHKFLQETGWGNIVSYIYDELLMEIKEEHIEEAANKIASIMQVEDLFGIPFLTEVKVGTSYGNLQEWYKDKDGIWHQPKEPEEEKA